MLNSNFPERGSGTISHRDVFTDNPSSSDRKTYVFVLAIFTGLGGLAIAGVGAAGYFQIGLLCNMSPTTAIILMTVGGGSGIILLTIGIVGTLKNQKTLHKSKKFSMQRENTSLQNSQRPSVAAQATNSSRPSRLNNREQHENAANGTQAEFIEWTSRMAIRGNKRFGKEQWEKYFGSVGEEPPLPSNLEEILNSPCPFSGNENIKVKDTHMLVLIPATVNGIPLTLDKLEELVKNPQNGGGFETKYAFYGEGTREDHGSTPVDRSYWVLMTGDMVPGSGNKTYDEQEELLRPHGYVCPGVLEAAVCILMEHASSGNKLFDTETLLRCTRCSEGCEGTRNHVMIGGFSDEGLWISIDGFLTLGNRRLGIAGVRRF